MRTLRGVFSKMAEWGYDFWHEYGSYRVVEGELYEEAGRIGIRRYGITTEGHDRVAIDPIGYVGDNVKLILPPEKKAEPAAPILELTKKLGRERVRADRYEKALREIARRVWKAQDIGAEAWVMGFKTASRIASEALDE